MSYEKSGRRGKKKRNSKQTRRDRPIWQKEKTTRRTIMDASDLLLDQWSQQVKEIFPSLHAYQQKTIALCVQGIIESGTAVMQHIAEILWEHLGSEAKMVSYERRL
jgi:hypothetical protein